MTETTANAPTMVDVLRRHLEPTLEMLGQTIHACPDGLWDARDTGPRPAGPPFWQIAYHVLVGLDFWLSDTPQVFRFPPFHRRDALLESGETSPIALSREQIRGYLEQVVRKSQALLDRLTLGALTEEAEFAGKAWTPADRILTQIRHVQHHVGQMNGILKHKAYKTPGWVGFNE